MKMPATKRTTKSDLKSLMQRHPERILAVAESMTGGQVQARIAAIPGASKFFTGGIVAYSLAQKVRHLGVGRSAAARVNSVSSAVAVQMARGVCVLFKANLGVATTGYAEPSPAHGVEEPFAWWAIVARRPRGVETFRFGRVECPRSSRVDAQVMVAAAVVAELESFLREVGD
jgi:nicotinamide-nucleotide amidase